MNEEALYYADSEYGEVRIYDRQASLKQTLGRLGMGPGEFNTLVALAVTDEGICSLWRITVAIGFRPSGPQYPFCAETARTGVYGAFTALSAQHKRQHGIANMAVMRTAGPSHSRQGKDRCHYGVER